MRLILHRGMDLFFADSTKEEIFALNPHLPPPKKNTYIHKIWSSDNKVDRP